MYTACTSKVEQDKPHKQRIIVSTDIGGTDFDDFQSMVHLLVYADTLDLEGIISSPYGDGRKSHILEAIDAYEKDYPNLLTYSKDYPSADSLRKIVKQGAEDLPDVRGYATLTEGSEWIIKCARKTDSRPLNILIWGGIDDLAQALHDAPDILPKLRVYYIGGPNKKWSVNAYQYIVDHFKALWIIESNASYYGWFEGGNQTGDYGNTEFVEKHIKNNGALGAYFYAKGENMKMGDTPSVVYFLKRNPEDPTQPSWGGQYVRAWDRRFKSYDRITTATDSIEEYGVLELRLPYSDAISEPYAKMNIENQSIEAFVQKDTVRFLFSPKRAADWSYEIESNIPSINNLAGQLTSYLTPPSNMNFPSSDYPNWWVDDPSFAYRENNHIGVKTVNKWREEFLDDFASRMERCSKPAN